MRDGGGARLFGAADLHGDNGLVQRTGAGSEFLEAGDRVKAFDVQPEHRDALVFDQAERHFGKAGLRLVAGRHQESHRQAALLHGQVAGDVGRLRDDGDAAFARLQPQAAMLIRPQQRAVGIVDEPVAVRADDRHLARPPRPVRACSRSPSASSLPVSRKPGRKADRAAGAARGQLADDVDGEIAVDGDEGGVGRFRQVGDGPEGRDAMTSALLGCTGQIAPA